jgi:hypothetical protein
MFCAFTTTLKIEREKIAAKKRSDLFIDVPIAGTIASMTTKNCMSIKVPCPKAT